MRRYVFVLAPLWAVVLQGQTSPSPLAAFVAPQGGVLGGTTIDGRIFANSFTVETRTGFFGGVALGVPIRDWLQLYTDVGVAGADGDAFGASDDISMQQLEGGIRLVRLAGPAVMPFVQLGVGARDLNGNSWRMRGLFADATAGLQFLPGRTTAFELSVSHAVGSYASLEHRELYLNDPQLIHFTGDPQTSGGGMTRLAVSLAWRPGVLATPPAPAEAPDFVDGRIVRLRVGGTAIQGELLSKTPDALLVQIRTPAFRQVTVPLACVRGAEMLYGHTARSHGMMRRGIIGVMVGTVIAAALANEHVFNDSRGDDMAMLGYGATVALPAGVLAMLTGRGGNEQWQRVTLPQIAAPPACGQFL